MADREVGLMIDTICVYGGINDKQSGFRNQ